WANGCVPVRRSSSPGPRDCLPPGGSQPGLWSCGFLDVSRSSGRQSKSEDGPAVGTGQGFDTPPVPFNDLLADGQPDSVAGILGSGMQAVENDEDAFQVFGRYADSVVGH